MLKRRLHGLTPAHYSLIVVGTGFASTFFLREYLRHASADELTGLETAVAADVDAAVKFAFDSPLTDPIEVTRDVFAPAAA